MARTVGKLTALAVTQAKQRGYYGDGGGLYLQVSRGGAKSWVFRFKEAGKLREMGLGPLHTIGLAEARRRAQECRVARLDGRDPIEARRADRVKGKLDAAKAITFRACAERYIGAHKAGWRSPKSLGRHARCRCLPHFRDAAGPGDRYGSRHESDRADMDNQAGDCEPGPRPDRKHPRLGDGARPSAG
jgi:hypothetical protein